jgi:hypothetical protein
MWNAVLYFSIFLIGINQNVNIFLIINLSCHDFRIHKAVQAKEEQMAANMKAGNTKPAWWG